MDALFVRVPNPFREDSAYRHMTPDSLLTLASHLNGEGWRCRILDLDPSMDATDAAGSSRAADRVADLVSEVLDECAFRMLGFTTLSWADARLVVNVAERLRPRYPHVPIVLGGIFATTNSRQILEECPCIDAVVVGEGETPMSGFLSRLAQKSDPFDGSVPGLSFRRDGQIVETARPDVFDLRRARPVDFSLLATPDAYDMLAYHTSRGCPHRCAYCLEIAMGRPYRRKPLDVVRHDLLAFQNVRTRDFCCFVSDPMVAVSEAGLREISALFSTLGVDYVFETRVDALPPAMVPAFRASGCRLIYLGFESASFDTLLRMNKLGRGDYAHYRKYLEQTEALVRACAASNVSIRLGVMLGYPGDTVADILISLEFIRTLRSAFVQSMTSKDSRAEFLPSANAVNLPAGSSAWQARGYFAEKGLELSDESLFGRHRITRASYTLGSDEVGLFIKAFQRESIKRSRPLRSEDLETAGATNRHPGVAREVNLNA